MNKHTRPFIALAGVFILGSMAGGIAGGYAASRFHGNQQLSAVELRAVNHAKLNLALLQWLKAGKADLVHQRLEAELDSNIITLGALKGQAGRMDSGASVEGSLVAAADHRATNPWATGDASIDEHVAQVLRSVQRN